jgi:hypoxanthine-DNA glycosylase
MLVRGFDPIVGNDAQVLILGTLPGGVSLIRQEYYADSGNAFWFIVQQLFGIEQTTTYKERTQGLIKNHIAIWDVLKCAERHGSLGQDSSLDKKIVPKTEVANNFAAFFRAYPSIRNVFFNGDPPKQYFDQLVVPVLQMDAETPQFNSVLQSTSGTNSHYTKEQKVEKWRIVQRTLASLQHHEISSSPQATTIMLGRIRC